MIGGVIPNIPIECSNSVERFDLREEKCEQLSSMRECRYFAAAAEHNGKIYATGGFKVIEEPYWNLAASDTVEMFAIFNNLQKWE